MRVHPSWQEVIDNAFTALSPSYRTFLEEDEGYFPTKETFLSAFTTLSRKDTKAILFGQDPYPRAQSAIGYAFIDGAVTELFSEEGFSKQVNRATSLRNFLKMQLIAEGYLTQEDVSQEAIAGVDKKGLITSIMELKDNFERNGILLLNTALIFTCKDDSKKHVKAFTPFIKALMHALAGDHKELILFGTMAKSIEKLLPFGHNYSLIKTMHPYNIDFINDKEVQAYFGAMRLLQKR